MISRENILKIIIVCQLLFLPLQACSEAINIEKLNFELGLQSMKQEDYPQAIKYFKLVVDKNPYNIEAHYNLAVAYKKAGKDAASVQEFEKVVDLLNTPEITQPEPIDIDQIRENRKNLTKSDNFNVYKDVKSKENAYIDLGDMHKDSRENLTAIEYYNLALQINPYNGSTYFKIAECYMAMENYFQAEPYIVKAVELDGNNPQYLYYKDVISKRIDTEYIDGVKLKEQLVNKIPGATSENFSSTNNSSYRQSQELDYIDTGDLHFDNQAYEAAIEYYKLALGINPNNDYIHYKLSRCYINLENLDKANEYIDRALALSKENKKYAYFKNEIKKKIARDSTGKESYISAYKSQYNINEAPGQEIAAEPGDHYRETKKSLWDKITSKPDLSKLVSVPKKGYKALRGKISKKDGDINPDGQLRPEDQNYTIFNRDMKYYEADEPQFEEQDRLAKNEYQRPVNPEERKTALSANYFNERGVEFFKNGNLIKAENYFKKAIQLKPMFAKAYNNLANVEFKRGNLVNAEALSLKAVEVNPELVDAYYNLAMIARTKRDSINELVYLDKAVEANPKFYKAYFARAMFYNREGNYNKARSNFKEVLSLKNDHYLASQNLGIIYANELNNEQASRYLAQAIRLNKNNPRSYYYLGVVKQASGEMFDAIENYRKSIELNPTNYKAYLSLSKCYEKESKPEKALEVIEQAIVKNPSNAELYNYLGLASLKFDRYEDAMAAFKKAVEINPKRPIYHYNLSQCYICLNKRKEAKMEFQRAVTIIPHSIQSYIDIAEIFYDRNMISYAITTLKEGITKLANNDYLYLVLSDFYERTGAKNSARAVLEEYLINKPDGTFSILVQKRLNNLRV